MLQQNVMALDAHTFEREHVRRPARSWLSLSKKIRMAQVHANKAKAEGPGEVAICGNLFHTNISLTGHAKRVAKSAEMRTMPKKKLEVQSRTGERQVWLDIILRYLFNVEQRWNTYDIKNRFLGVVGRHRIQESVELRHCQPHTHPIGETSLL